MPENKIKISFAPLLLILVLIALALGVGFVWDAIRTTNKLRMLEQKVELIYKSHEAEFLAIADFNSFTESAKLLCTINAPEKNIYYVYVLRKLPDGDLKLFRSRYEQNCDYEHPTNAYEDTGFSFNDQKELEKALNNNQTTSSNKELFKSLTYWNAEGSLYAFTPIKNGQETAGWVVLRLPKTTDI